MPSCELEILYQAASCTGRNAGRIRWTPDSVPNTLTAGATHSQFSYDSARKEMYWEALNNLVREGYVVPDGSSGYLVSDTGYEIAEECCHEWWRRQFVQVHDRRSGRAKGSRSRYDQLR